MTRSVPSQRRAALAHCDTIGRAVVAEFVDAVSGTDDARPDFQRMLELTRQPGCPFDTIVVHSLSRFYRSGPEAELLIRDLAKKGIRVQSVSQPIGDDHTQVMLRQIIGVLDEHTSRENGKNVRRAMRENAEQGFWNGTPTPLGYESVEAERRGTKVKKRLAVEPVEAETLHIIFDLYDRGLPGRGALGVKEITNVLNERGYRTRKGARFGVGPVHAILTSDYYATGLYPYTVGTGQLDAPDAAKVTVHIPIPKLIDEAQFERVQAKLASRNPNVTPPRVVNGPALLAGLTSCAVCAAGLMRTGTTRRGKRYSYYSCAGHQLKGKTECRGCHVPADKLDDAVLGALKERLFAPGRLGEILRVLLDRQKRNDAEVTGRVADLKAAVADAAGRLKRLYRLVEDGAVEVDDVLEDRLRVLRAEKAKAEAALGRAGTRSEAACVIDEAVLERFGQLMRDKLYQGDVNARRAYIASVVSAIEVGHDRIRIVGQRDTLQRLVRQQEGGVPGFVRGWRAPMA